MIVGCWKKWLTGFAFCKFKYYKELANEINYPLSKINQQLGYINEDRCWLLGYRLKQPHLAPAPEIIDATVQTTSPVQQDKKEEQKQVKSDEQVEQKDKKQLELEYDPLGREYLNFADIRKFAEKMDMDVCSADPQAKEVALVKFRQSIYRHFYQTRLFKKNSTGKKHKQIRVPEKIQDHDILTKVANIRSLIKKGEFKFKIFSENDTAKSQKAIKKLCNYLGRRPELKIQKFELQQKAGRRKAIIIERWMVMLDFSTESKVDYQQINRKWRRHLIQLKVSQQRKQKNKQRQGEGLAYNLEGLENQPIQLQREMLKQMREHGVPLPSKFREYGMMEDMLDASGQGFFFQNLEKFKPGIKETLKLHTIPSISKKKKQKPQTTATNEDESQSSQSESDSQSSSSSQQQQQQHPESLTPPARKQLDALQPSAEQLKQLRIEMKARTVEQILQEMELIKGDKTELNAYEMHRVKMLERELKWALKLGGYREKV